LPGRWPPAHGATGESETDMLKVNVEIEGRTCLDVEAALTEVLRSLESGNTSGFGRNGDGRYSFEVSGEDEAGEQLCGSPFAHDLCSHD
jgi:hypothetical protein